MEFSLNKVCVESYLCYKIVVVNSICRTSHLGEETQLPGGFVCRGRICNVQLRHFGTVTRASVGHVEQHAHVKNINAATQLRQRLQELHAAVGEQRVGQAVAEGVARLHPVRMVPGTRVRWTSRDMARRRLAEHHR